MSDETKNRLQFIINTAYFALIAVLVYLALKYAVGWVLPFLLALLIVSIVHPMIRRIKSALKIERQIVALIIMVLVYILVFALLSGLVSLIVMAIKDLIVMLPSYYDNTIYPSLININNRIFTFLGNLPAEWQAEIANMQSEIIRSIQTLVVNISQKGFAFITSFSSKIPSFLIAFIFTIMLSFFISTQYDGVIAVLKRAMPLRAREVTADLKKVILVTVVRYFRATLTLMCITAVELAIGLFVIGYKNFIPMALAIAFFDALPFFGTGAIMIPWFVLELIQGNFPFAFGIIIVYAIVTVVRNIIEPKIISDKLGLNPILSLCSIYLGYRLFGVLGMIFMPILAQIFIALHQNGSISILKRFTDSEEMETTTVSPCPEDTPLDS